ncbi:MAG: lysophospholipid acyltransferase family protein [Candidatus Aminicenantes bacterium]|nr:lysophospholipid acyltransferase family protein [Candidatus Aminicenantes bacterium]MDH5713946.1 lysophospholipid acyltransferase family protein [Candidatus Aminicenantes bacterium]
MKNILEKLKLILIPFLGSLLIRFLRLTMSIDYINRSEVEKLTREGKNYIIAFWHGRLLMMPYSYFGSQINILISHHRDGEYISRAMRRFGFHSIRGSSSRGGVSALKQVLEETCRGSDIAMTPDGPRGPRQRVKPGVVQIARLSSLPVVPVSFSASRKKFLSSWDTMMIPFPFSQGTFIYGKAIWVSKDAAPLQMEQKRQEIEASLNEITARVDGLYR